MPIADPDERRRYAREWVARRRAAWFADKSCVDCGSVDKLELDHVDSKQKVSHSIWSWSQVRRDVEIAKCVVRCFPCHRAKTVANKENARGEAIGLSRLNPTLVQEILDRSALGESQRSIATAVGTSQGSVSRVVRGACWSHLGLSPQELA